MAVVDFVSDAVRDFDVLITLLDFKVHFEPAGCKEPLRALANPGNTDRFMAVYAFFKRGHLDLSRKEPSFIEESPQGYIHLEQARNSEPRTGKRESAVYPTYAFVFHSPSL